ncbi:SDR family oxidoreductase [Celeribacter persicus]|jgi:Dehydrogenases with different specificities (related to short-chain alcohol dehydrogenases)|uniref:NAD(P)-dependent dehydrogenase (Short-subunit alcohol dehydrogenase family) n=1 Tax=Celeribacter persicus TaxID=1651082 RepID=A0A2T5HPM4_9RHOB|nr:SDR family oxidoreductase [Celeribacter persicus]PTQ73497.1 NAD(P)-dependent dehydrogenase (short-subunit alcohol dehydrogenase family) [Celeribacter persicus]
MTLRKALVTGAGQRLGRAMALFLGEMGFDVAVHCHRSDAEAAEVVEALRAMGRKASVLKADLLDEAQVETLIPRAVEALGGPLTLLVNNASLFEDDTLATATRQSWDRHFESNLRAPFVLLQQFAAQAPDPVMEDDGRPRAQALVVNMIDQRVRKLTPQFMSYTLAKSALWTLTQTAAQALAPRVRINGIGPGPTLQGARQSENDFVEQRRSTLLERGGDPSDVTAALAYLITAPAVTGQLICPDGGQHLAWQTPDVQGKE